MKNAVILKGNRYGITIVLDSELEFSALLTALEERLEGAEEFFDSNKQLAVTFEGRVLSNEELDKILDVIRSSSKLNIQYVVEENSDLETTFYDIIQSEATSEQSQELPVEVAGVLQDGKTQDNMQTTWSAAATQEDAFKEQTGMFYKGTLRTGQTLEAKGSLVIIGDVNHGASIVAEGNVVILGILKGSVTAGSNGNRQAFISALGMNPAHLQIADVTWNVTDSRKLFKQKHEAMIATIIDQQIAIESVSKAMIHDNYF